MKRAVLTVLFALLSSMSARAEVSIDHTADGPVVFFMESQSGPWTVVRPRLNPDDVLNAWGNLEGDGWPLIGLNAGTELPDVVWVDGPTGQIQFSGYDGEKWTATLSLSLWASSLPVYNSDGDGNRFVAWSDVEGTTDPVYVTFVNQLDEQADVIFLAENDFPLQGARIAMHDDGGLWTAFEVGGSGEPKLALDRLSAVAVDGGEDPIDWARIGTTVPTMHEAGQPLKQDVHFDSGHLWAEWEVSPFHWAYFELIDGVRFTEPVEIVVYGSDEHARAVIRALVLGQFTEEEE